MTWSIRRAARGVGVALLAAAVVIGGAAAALGAQTASRPVARAGVPSQTGSAPAAAVPPRFKANSITWASPQQGWVLGAAPCGAKRCTEVIGTTDGAKTWNLLGMVNASIPKGPSTRGITEIRFATADVGWAFGPGLFRTSNGGRSWTPVVIPGHGKEVLDLASNATGVYAVVSPCATQCTEPYTLWRSATQNGSSWTHISLSLPSGAGADVAVYDKTVYVVDPSDPSDPSKFYASTDGIHFSARPVPCASSIPLIQAVPTSATDVAVLCDGNPGMSLADKYVFTSTNTGKTDTYAGTMGAYGIQAELAASPSGNLAAASVSDGSFMYINDTHKRAWTMVIGKSDGGGGGWNDIVYVTNTEAWVVYGPLDWSAGFGQVYVTYDGGHHWSQAEL